VQPATLQINRYVLLVLLIKTFSNFKMGFAFQNVMKDTSTNQTLTLVFFVTQIVPLVLKLQKTFAQSVLAQIPICFRQNAYLNALTDI